MQAIQELQVGQQNLATMFEALTTRLINWTQRVEILDQKLETVINSISSTSQGQTTQSIGEGEGEFNFFNFDAGGAGKRPGEFDGSDISSKRARPN
jgi:hypothetical protein